MEAVPPSLPSAHHRSLGQLRSSGSAPASKSERGQGANSACTKLPRNAPRVGRSACHLRTVAYCGIRVSDSCEHYTSRGVESDELDEQARPRNTHSQMLSQIRCTQHCLPPLQRTQGWGTLFGNGASNKTKERWATRHQCQLGKDHKKGPPFRATLLAEMMHSETH